MELAVTRMKRISGFSLLELMVVLSIISVIAAASVPQIQLWMARNKGVEGVSKIISDFTKAKQIAAYTTNNTGNIIGARPQTALYFDNNCASSDDCTTSYYILQRSNMSTSSWSETNDNIVVASELPVNVWLTKINTLNLTNHTVVITSSGRITQENRRLVQLNIGGDLQCGTINSPLNGSRIFLAEMRSNISGNSNSLWYRIEISQTGDYFVCTSTKSDFSENANILEL
jgi:prepilin-type N-terminal cleavage/methylation domain-containing protein